MRQKWTQHCKSTLIKNLKKTKRFKPDPNPPCDRVQLCSLRKPQLHHLKSGASSRSPALSGGLKTRTRHHHPQIPLPDGLLWRKACELFVLFLQCTELSHALCFLRMNSDFIIQRERQRRWQSERPEGDGPRNPERASRGGGLIARRPLGRARGTPPTNSSEKAAAGTTPLQVLKTGRLCLLISRHSQDVVPLNEHGFWVSTASLLAQTL